MFRSLRLLGAALLAVVMASPARAQTDIPQFYITGPQQPAGSDLNKMVNAINHAVGCITYAPAGTPSATDVAFFVAPRAMRVVSAYEVHSVAAGGTSVLQLVKDTGTDAPGAGTDLLTTGWDLNATANTAQAGALTTTAAVKTLAAGNRLSLDYANSIQSTAGLVVTVCLQPIDSVN